MQDIGEYVQRQMVQTVIQLANGYQGGSWQLVDVSERAIHTELTFELTHPMVDLQNQVARVTVIIEPHVQPRREL